MAVITATRPKLLRAEFPDCSLGAGAYDHVPGYYSVMQNADGRWGAVIPGPREVVDRTGIAAGFRVRKQIRHADTQVLLATDGTDTRIYRQETTWVQKAAIVAAVGIDLVSYNAVLAVSFGPSTAYQFTTGVGAGAWTFTASTKAGNAKFANYFLLQQNGLSNPLVAYVRNPNELYTTTDLTNSGTSTTASTIGDPQTAQDFFTSITEDDNGVRLIGKRHALFSIDSAGIVVKLTPDYPDPLLDAGGQSDRNNFEAWTQIAGRTYYVIGGYDIGEYYHGSWNPYLAPRWAGPQIPRMHLPINALASAGGYLLAFLGTKNPTTLKNVTNAPGGAALLQNTFTATSDLWAGRYQPNPKTGSEEMVWHGVLLQCTDPLRYAWFDEDDSYLYLCSGDSEAADAQQRRCYFVTVPPQFQMADAANVILQNGAWTVEYGRVTFGDEWTSVRLLRAMAKTMGLAATAPSLALSYRAVQEWETTAYASLVTWNDNYHSRNGVRFPRNAACHVLNLQAIGTSTGSTYAILESLAVEAEPYIKTGVGRG